MVATVKKPGASLHKCNDDALHQHYADDTLVSMHKKQRAFFFICKTSPK